MYYKIFYSESVVWLSEKEYHCANYYVMLSLSCKHFLMFFVFVLNNKQTYIYCIFFCALKSFSMVSDHTIAPSPTVACICSWLIFLNIFLCLVVVSVKTTVSVQTRQWQNWRVWWGRSLSIPGGNAIFVDTLYHIQTIRYKLYIQRPIILTIF